MPIKQQDAMETKLPENNESRKSENKHGRRGGSQGYSRKQQKTKNHTEGVQRLGGGTKKRLAVV